MKGYYYLNFNDLSREAQEQLIRDAIEDLIEKEGLETLQEEARLMNIDFDTFITERAQRHMHTFNFVFNV